MQNTFHRWIILELLKNCTEQNVKELAFALAEVGYHFARRLVACHTQ